MVSTHQASSPILVRGENALYDRFRLPDRWYYHLWSIPQGSPRFTFYGTSSHKEGATSLLRGKKGEITKGCGIPVGLCQVAIFEKNERQQDCRTTICGAIKRGIAEVNRGNSRTRCDSRADVEQVQRR